MLKDLRKAGEPQSVAWVSDTDRGTTAELCRRFLTVYGSPNYIRTPSMQDAYEMALYLTQGNRAMAGLDLGQRHLRPELRQRPDRGLGLGPVHVPGARRHAGRTAAS